MFTGIIETTGKIIDLKKNAGNLDLIVASPISGELKIDQSISHNGVCLTVVELLPGAHRVTAIDETLKKTNLGALKINDAINLERCMKIGDRLDGHIVQGHVDQTAECISVEFVGKDKSDKDGSWLFQFRYTPSKENLIVEKGSICINGISLTAFESNKDTFKVAIIPYTYQYTNIGQVKKGFFVNLEFDVIGKYVARMMEFKD